MKMASILFIIILIVSCNSKKSANDVQQFIDSLNMARKVDSMTNESIKTAMMDTTGLYTAPVIILSASLVKQSYSNYKDVQLHFKNISDKKIDAIRFKWYGVDAFGDPADLGSYTTDGFGGGFDDDPIGPGKSRYSSWSVLSSRGKKISLAWPYEVVFADGSKWSLADSR